MLRMQSSYPVPPGPTLRQMFFRKGNILDLIGEVHATYGKIAHFPLGADRMPIYFIFDPDAIERVMVSNRDNYKKSRTLSRTDALLGNGILLAEGAKWKRNRRLMAPAFHGRAITGYVEQMQAASDEEFATWESGALIEDIHPLMMNMALDIAVRTLFGQDVGQRERSIIARSLEMALDHFARTLRKPWKTPAWMPTPRVRRVMAAIDELNDVVYGIIDARRASGEEREDVLGMLLSARDEDDGTGMSDVELRDEVMTLLLAGHETTAQALTFGIHMLGHHPWVQDRLREESEQPLTSYRDMKSLVYTDAVVNEILRTYPPAPMVGREAIGADELLGYHIPPGAQVVMSPWYMQRSPELWDHPNRFEPERWLNSDVPRHRFAFFPFGGGQRLCIGANFARMELFVGLRSLMQQTGGVKSIGPRELDITQSVTIRPTYPVPVVVK